MTSSDLIQRISRVTGKPVATMFVEEGTDRRLIAEFTLGAVALYLAGKYLEGFIAGLGIEDLGKRHGKAVVSAISAAESIIRGAFEEPEAQAEIQRQERYLVLVVEAFAEHSKDPKARTSAEDTVRVVLEARDLPPTEALKLTTAIGVEVFGPKDG